MTNPLLQNHVAVVTGGASGIGLAIAQTFSKAGATVVVLDFNEKGKPEVEKIAGASFMRCDVRNAAEVENALNTVAAQKGRLDILVNNAGIDGEQASFPESKLDNWQNVIQTNLDGVYYGMRTGLRIMMAQKSGVILNMASIVGMVAFANLPAYSAAKAGVIQLTKAGALEGAPVNVRVNAICPSVVQTPLVEHFINTAADPVGMRAWFNNFNPMPGMVTTQAVADATLFLASSQAAFITGIALPIDGGYTTR
jgi:NAD(P)-dependent dehydrogenase (short-subunit alcohol dehydrogenase family)